MVEYRLYVGLNDRETHQQIIESIEANKIINRLLVKYVGFGTVFSGYGVYTDNVKTVIENSLIVSIIDISSCVTSGSLDKLITELKLTLNQDSILRQTIQTEANFQ